MKKMKKLIAICLAVGTIFAMSIIPTSALSCSKKINLDNVCKSLTNIENCDIKTVISDISADSSNNDFVSILVSMAKSANKGNLPCPDGNCDNATECPDGNCDKTDTSNPSNIGTVEEEILELVNIERAKYGLSPLKLNSELCSLAKTKSCDMSQNNYFSHTSPTYGSAFDMMKAANIKYNTAGENIAQGYKTAEAVMKGWMNSEGHRANILNSSYTELGVGLCGDGYYWTQMFIG